MPEPFGNIGNIGSPDLSSITTLSQQIAGLNETTTIGFIVIIMAVIVAAGAIGMMLKVKTEGV